MSGIISGGTTPLPQSSLQQSIVSNSAAINAEDLRAMDKTSASSNKSAVLTDDRLFGVRSGNVVFSNKNAEKANAVIISDNGIVITNSIALGGIQVSDSKNSIQGVVSFSSKGTRIRKGEFTENDKASREYTYRETVMSDTVPDVLRSTFDSLNVIGFELDGIAPIITDPSVEGGPGHFHTISMKHTHRIEPAYLYKVPAQIGILRNCIGRIVDFAAQK